MKNRRFIIAEGCICMDSKKSAWVVPELDLILKNGTELEVLHDGVWQKAVVADQFFLHMYEIDDYKRIKCNVLVRKKG